MSHPKFPHSIGVDDQNFSCKVFTSKNITEVSKTILKKPKSEGGNWKTSRAQPGFRLPVLEFRLHTTNH